MDNLAQSFTAGLDRFLSNGRTGGGGGQSSPDKAPASKVSRTTFGEKRKPDEPVTHAFLEDAMRAGMGGFAEVAAQHFARIDSRQTAVEMNVHNIGEDVQSLKAENAKMKGDQDDLRKTIASMKEEMIALQGALGEGSQQQQRQEVEKLQKEVQDMLTRIPQESEKIKNIAPSGSSCSGLRLWATIGCLGWDLPAHEQLTRARQLLQEAGVDASKYSCLSAKRDPGSIVNLRFNAESDLEDAKMCVRAAAKSWLDSGKRAWLDNMKSTQERKPAILIHRASDLANQILQKKGGVVKEVEKVMGGKQIKINSVVVAYAFGCQLRWAPAAHEYFNQDEQDEVKGFAES